MTKTGALHRFFERILPSYEETTVPDDAVLPYITYSVATDSFNYPVSIQFSLWCEGTSWQNINAKTEEISHLIDRGGVLVPYDNGAMWITKGTPFAQNVPDENENIRRKLINLTVEYLSE